MASYIGSGKLKNFHPKYQESIDKELRYDPVVELASNIITRSENEVTMMKLQ